MADDTIDIPEKYHSHFIRNKASLIRQIENEFGVRCRFPPKNSPDGSRVTLRGPKDLLGPTKERLYEIVKDLEETITIEFEIDNKYQRSVMGAKGSNLQALEEKYNVKIFFPKKPQPSAENGWLEEPSLANETAAKNNIIKVVGRIDNCENAKAELLLLVPVAITVNVPFEYHKFLLRQKALFLKSLRDLYNVNVSVPKIEEQSDIITITGVDAQVKKAKKALEDKVKEIQKEKKAADELNYREELHIKSEYHPKIIGKNGSVVKEIRKAHEVRIVFPDKSARDDETGENGSNNDFDLIVVIGSKKNVEAAARKINKMVKGMESLIKEVIEFSDLVHESIVEMKGKTVRELTTRFNADIRIDGENNTITISGNESNVKKARKHFNQLIESLVVKCADEKRYRAPKVFSLSNELDLHTNGRIDGFYSRNPEVSNDSNSKPNTKDRSEFPSMKQLSEQVEKPKVFWGPKKNE